MILNDAPPWTARAFCRGADPQIFDGEPLYEETAKAYCARCPVRVDCLEYALSGVQVVGIWGGLNEAERRAVRRGGSRARCPGCRGTAHFSDGISGICLSCGLTWRL